MKQKGLAPILIIILIAALAVGGYLIYKLPRTVVPPQTPQPTPAPSSTPDTTANWKTYTDKDYTFKYPSNWDYDFLGNGSSVIIAPQQTIDWIKRIKGATEGGSWETVLIYKSNTDPAPKSSDFESITSENIILNNQNATLYTSKIIEDIPGFANGAITKQVVIKHNSYFLIINLLDDKQINIFNQILSTFKFTN